MGISVPFDAPYLFQETIYDFLEVIMQALLLFADNNSWPSLPSVDIWFFIICALIIVAIIVIYYLLPVFNKKKYKEQRDNLEKREAAFKANHAPKEEQTSTAETVTTEHNHDV